MSRYFLLMGFIFVSYFSIAQKNKIAEDEIRQLENEIVNAILKGDTNALKRLWAPEYLVNNPRNSITSSLDSVLALQKNNIINYSRFERNIEAFQFQKKFVITMGNEMFVPKNDIPGAKAG